MNQPRFFFLSGMILVAAAARLVPHPPNFSPIAALAVFGGAQFNDKRLAFLMPLAAMFLSDLILGLHSLMPVIYGSFALIVCLGFWVQRNQNLRRIGGAALVGALLFFITTNFGVWWLTSFYPKTGGGLLACYTEAIPFFWNTLASDLIFTAVLFGGLRAAEWRWPVLHPTLATC